MSDQSNGNGRPTPWHTIRLHEFRAPKEPTSEALRQTFTDLWHRLWHRSEHALPNLEDVPELKSAPRSLLDRLVPTPAELPGAAQAIHELLDDHYEQEASRGPVLVLVVPPHMPVEPHIRSWAKEREIPAFNPPTPRDIMKEPTAWLDAHLPVDAEYAVIPHLERYYLRHYRGLYLVRRYIESLWQSGQRGIVTCDSWAWAFLEHVCPTNLLQPHPFTVAPFEADDLEVWIRTQVRQTYSVPVTFRRADSGKKAVRDETDDDDQFSDEYLVHLAAYSRGNPMVAWSIWRDSLSIAAADEDNIKPSAQAEAAEDRGHTVWVSQWERVARPALSGSIGTTRQFLLHSLLLHGGLDLTTLQSVLTIPLAEVGRHIQPLQSAGIIEGQGDRWQVTAAAYPAIRSYLHQEGFLVDSL